MRCRLSNFFGWFLTVCIFYQLFALYFRNRVSIPSPGRRLASRHLILCRICGWKSRGCGPAVSRRSFRGCHRETLDDPRHSLGISPGFYFSHHASQPNCLGQNRQTSRTLLETGPSGYSERLNGYPKICLRIGVDLGVGEKFSISVGMKITNWDGCRVAEVIDREEILVAAA
jgi:hypothetical protein